jgi:cobalt-zinc-cadmium efflux system outer membrane protein
MYKLLLIIIAITASSVSQAATFDEYLQRLKEHPQVSEALAHSNKYNELSKGEMGLPDPQLILGVDNVPVNDPAFDRFLPSSKVLGFRQAIPSYGLRKAKSEKQKGMSVKQKLFADYTIERLEAYLITALVELDKVKSLREYAGKQLTYYVELENHLKGQLESGSSVYGRFSEIDVERTEVEQKLNNLKAEQSTIEAELVRLVGEIPDITFPNIPILSWSNGVEQAYAVLIAKEDIGIASQGVKAANSAFGPNYGVQALYKQREDGSNFAGDDWFSVQATISVPLWYHWNQKPKLRAAESGKQAAEFSYDDMKRMWQKKLTSLASERDVALENISLLQERKGAIREIVASAERNYEAGNAELESVLDAQIDELTILSQLASQRSRHMKLSAEFNSHIMGDK